MLDMWCLHPDFVAQSALKGLCGLQHTGHLHFPQDPCSGTQCRLGRLGQHLRWLTPKLAATWKLEKIYPRHSDAPFLHQCSQLNSKHGELPNMEIVTRQRHSMSQTVLQQEELRMHFVMSSQKSKRGKKD